MDSIDVKLDVVLQESSRDSIVPKDEGAAQLMTRSEAAAYRELTGEDRAMLYLVAAYTGLRAHELASLDRSSFDLDAGIVSVAAAYSKRRKLDRLPLRPDLVEKLHDWLRGKSRKLKLWPGAWWQKAARML